MAERTVATSLLRGWDTAALAAHTAMSIIDGSARLIGALLTPRHEFTSSILSIELRCRTSTEIGLFGLLVALSPREVCVALGTRPARAFVYALDAPDAGELAERMQRVETRILRVTRGRNAVQEVVS